MASPMSETEKPFAKQATEKLFALLNRADELGGELRDQIQEKMATDARYIKARKAVAKLSEEQKRVVQLSFFEDKPHAEIATDLNIPLGTVKSRIRLAMKHLRSHLGEVTEP